jgi:hypothetical protein
VQVLVQAWKQLWRWRWIMIRKKRPPHIRVRQFANDNRQERLQGAAGGITSAAQVLL